MRFAGTLGDGGAAAPFFFAGGAFGRCRRPRPGPPRATLDTACPERAASRATSPGLASSAETSVTGFVTINCGTGMSKGFYKWIKDSR